MKKNLFFIIAFVTAFFISCEEDDNKPSKNSHRIMEIINFSPEENEGYKAVFTYIDEKINEVLEYYDEGSKSWSLDSKSTIEYTDDDFIIVMYDYYGSSWELSSKYEFNFTDGLLMEIIEYDYDYKNDIEPSNKETFTYSGKNITKSEYYYFELSNWLLDEKTELIYTDGKVSEIKGYFINESDQLYQYDKETFIYEDKKIKEWIDYYKEETIWEYDNKYIYNYSGDLVSRIDSYYYYDTWDLDETTLFTYNENDFLTQVNSTDFVSTFTYEKGNGNYSRFMNPISKVYGRPSPKNTKKQNIFIKGVLDKYSLRKNN